jgi:hypothetical protein
MLKLILLSFMFIAVSCQAINTDVKTFFAAPEDSGKKLPANKIYPQGKLFPFSFYSTGGGSEKKRKLLLPEKLRLADQKKIIDGGVTMIGPQYELNNQVLQDAKKYNVKVVYSLQLKVDNEVITKKYIRNLHKLRKPLDVKKVREAVRQEMAKVASNDCIAWWNLSPEEMRYWRNQEKNYLITVAKAVHDFDPKKRPVYMYEPGHVGAKRMTISGKYTDIIGKGIYANYSGMKLSRVFCRWSVEQELEAIKMLGKSDKTPIAVVEMFQDPLAKEIKLIEDWARHDVYCSLAAGAKGVLIFSASRRPKFKVREKYLDAYLKICGELQSELGQAILFGTRKNDLTVDTISGPKEIKFKFYTHPEKTYPTISFANIAYKNSRYLILVNSANEPVEAILDGLVYGSKVTIHDIFKKSKFTAPEGQVEMKFKALEVKVFKVTLQK